MLQWIISAVTLALLLALFYLAVNTHCYTSLFNGYSGKYVMILCRPS